MLESEVDKNESEAPQGPMPAESARSSQLLLDSRPQLRTAHLTIPPFFHEQGLHAYVYRTYMYTVQDVYVQDVCV